jgi:uncharacterized membrane protein
MNRRTTGQLSRAAIIAALYMLLTMAPPFNAISYGPVQFRLGEALVLLPFILDEAVLGIVVGCLVANLFSPFGLIDVICGTAVTAVAALLTRRLRRTRRPWLSVIPPILLNGLVVSLYIAILSAPEAVALPAGSSLGATLQFVVQHVSWKLYVPVAISVLAGEAAVTIILGLPVLALASRAVLRGPWRSRVS